MAHYMTLCQRCADHWGNRNRHILSGFVMAQTCECCRQYSECALTTDLAPLPIK